MKGEGAAADELQAKCFGQSQQIFMLSAFVRCSSGAFYFYYSGQCPGELDRRAQKRTRRYPPHFLGLMKMKATATATPTCAYPPSNGPAVGRTIDV